MSKTMLQAELSRFMPDEIVVPKIKVAQQMAMSLRQWGYFVTEEDYEHFSNQEASDLADWFARQFNQDIEEQDDASKSCLTLFYAYLKKNNERALAQLKQLFMYQPEDFLMLDASTQKNLELVRNVQDNSSSSTLFHVLDQAASPMGSRLLKKWILRPLIKQESIEQRFNAVQVLYSDFIKREALQKLISKIGDLERVVGRISLLRAQIHDYRYLLNAVSLVPEIKAEINGFAIGSLLQVIDSKISDFSELDNLLSSSINDDSSSDWLIKDGYNQELDKLRMLVEGGNQAIANLEAKEQKATGISSLKIRYNNQGYAIEVTKPNVHLVPEYFFHIQSLTNRERYTSDELKNLEYDINRARTSISSLEKEIFEDVKNKVFAFLNPLKKLSSGIAYLDVLSSLAEVAYNNQYVRPTFNQDKNIIIENGRHPVIELQHKNKFIANNTTLTEEQSLWIITGPNMGGKSTFMRQVALMSIMAQIGSFVPATKADLFVVDRIFTRIGAADNLAEGKSTFLVEMEETALICNQATANSLVILDEVGRGTSTYDGIAIAHAVIEYIYSHVKARCLFATHYHELTDLGKTNPGIACYYASSASTPEGIVLLHKILPGVADGSFGLEVAKIANLPKVLVDRAYEIINSLSTFVPSRLDEDSQMLNQKIRELQTYIEQKEQQTKTASEIVRNLSQTDCDNITAKQAYDLLWKLKDMVK